MDLPLNKTARRVLVATLLLAMTACTEPNPAYSPGPFLPDECRDGEEVSEVFESFEQPNQVDLLFMVSSADWMADKQRALSNSVEPMLEALEESGVDLRVAVSTMDPAQGSPLAPAGTEGPGCAGNADTIVEIGDEGWKDAVACNLRTGTAGDRRQRPLDILESVLVDNPLALTDFRRDRARLVVVMVTSQDDCSGDQFNDDPETPARNLCAWQSEDLLDVDQWSQEIQQAFGAPEGFSLAVISGPRGGSMPQPEDPVLSVCSSTLGSSYPAPRLHQAARALGHQGLFLSACEFDYADHLLAVADSLVMSPGVTVCPAELMAHEPLAVTGVDGDGAEEELIFGRDYAFPGSTESCPNGSILLKRQDAIFFEKLELTYCGL